MKLEYLAEGAQDCPLIRLYHFNQIEILKLKTLVKSLCTGDVQSVALQDELWVEAVGECRLALKSGNENQGVRRVSDLKFEWVLSSGDGVIWKACWNRFATRPALGFSGSQAPEAFQFSFLGTVNSKPGY